MAESAKKRDRKSESRRVMDAVRILVREIRLANTAAQKSHDVTAAQAFILKTLEQHPGLSINELADRTATDQSSVSVVVQRLLGSRLVQKERSKDDARSYQVRLSPSGRAVARRLPATPQERLIEALDAMSVRKQKALADLLTEWVQALGVDVSAPPMLFEDGGRRSARGIRKRL